MRRFSLAWRLGAALLVGLTCAALGVSAAEKPQPCPEQTAIGMPDWVRHAVVYEVNIRQYSEAGTLAAVTADLPRIRGLGVDVLWLMPIHPIGEQNRKGPLGSYYSIRDYLAVNPEFGTKEDFRQLVTAAHAQGLRVILDWVGNHTSWDNPMAKEHPEYYVRDAKGVFQPPTGFDWTDVIQLDFANPAVLEAQYAQMAYWVKEFGVNGYRCDFATGVPTSYWDALFAKLRQLRPDLFLLSESELPQHQLKAFNVNYAFSMAETFDAVAQGRAGVSHLDDNLAAMRATFPAGAARLYYTSNHDRNSWDGTEFERLGGGAAPLAVLTYVIDGVPLIYNGQEIGLDRRLQFFERDPIVWRSHPLTGFYRTLNQLKRTHPALATGAAMRRIATTRNDALYALVREAQGQRVVALLNLTARDVNDVTAYDPALAGNWQDVFTSEKVTFKATTPLALKAWQFRVLVSQP
ncbi:alpha-amylase family glycosyl hydrolase [Opitutus sp. ER46]|uniref:alpha-amylase family glycosyl hydrolase n=1 Tax=Opitutus sp. ER46 TaxID=2161864 RepID=UPI000D31F065|nr:alpha-amylase family glycosyl hydrolase [Opitutus sp. ER46]PTX91004.1 alpha-amylase [Opitutus sp. ER46]